MPGQQVAAILFQIPDDVTQFMRRKTGIERNREIMKPDLRFAITGANVNMSRFASFV